MPVFKLETNLLKAKIPSTFLQTLTSVIATALEKQENRCCVTVVPDLMMSFGGSTDVCGCATLASIGKLGVEENKKISASVSDHIEKELGIPKDRLYISFTDVAAYNIGHKGTTVQDLWSQASSHL